MLSEAKNMDDILHIRDIAEAARVYAKAAKLGLENQNEAAEIKIRAERKAGEMLAQMPKAEGGQPYQEKNSTGNIVLPVDTPTLSDLGIEKMQSSRWQMVASLPEDEFEELITETKANKKELTTSAIIKEVQKEKREQMHEDKRKRELPAGKYAVIYADPPWQYDNSGFDEAADNQYPTMPLDEICAIPVFDLSDDATVIFMWATNPLLPEALQVLTSWGFKYKTNMAWIKDKGRGKGWYLKSKHELLLIGVKDNTPHPQERPDSCFEADRGSTHSKKPMLAYEIIESMYPGNKIELFARNTREGWDCWGNEV